MRAASAPRSSAGATSPATRGGVCEQRQRGAFRRQAVEARAVPAARVRDRRRGKRHAHWGRRRRRGPRRWPRRRRRAPVPPPTPRRRRPSARGAWRTALPGADAPRPSPGQPPTARRPSAARPAPARTARPGCRTGAVPAGRRRPRNRAAGSNSRRLPSRRSERRRGECESNAAGSSRSSLRRRSSVRSPDRPSRSPARSDSAPAPRRSRRGRRARSADSANGRRASRGTAPRAPPACGRRRPPARRRAPARRAPTGHVRIFRLFELDREALPRRLDGVVVQHREDDPRPRPAGRDRRRSRPRREVRRVGVSRAGFAVRGQAPADLHVRAQRPAQFRGQNRLAALRRRRIPAQRQHRAHPDRERRARRQALRGRSPWPSPSPRRGASRAAAARPPEAHACTTSPSDNAA